MIDGVEAEVEVVEVEEEEEEDHIRSTAAAEKMDTHRNRGENHHKISRFFFITIIITRRFQRPSDNPHRRQHANPFDKPQQPPAAATFEQPAPVRGAFWCEPCDSDFPTGEQLAAHRAQHQRCSVDGCQFEGHAQLVSRHVQQQHTSGLFERIKNLQTPEEIERWREERKRRYPSSKNVALRQQIQEARQKRGERLEPQSSQRFGDKADRRQPPGATKSDVATKNDGHNAGGDVTANGKNKRRRKRNKTGQKDAAAVMLDEVAKLGDAVEEVNCGLPMFRGTSGMKGYRKPEVKVANALSGLLGAYDSEESEEVTSEEEAAEVLMPGEYPVLESSSECTEADGLVEKNEEIHEQKNDVETEQIETIPDENIEEPIEDDDADNGPPEEDAVERISSLPEMPEHATETPATTKRPSNENNTASSASAAKRSKTTMSLDLSRRYRNQNTMLEKLLQKDIRHERNVLLQCVRYVVEQKFFGIGQAK